MNYELRNDELRNDEPPIRNNHPGNQYIHTRDEQETNGNEPNDYVGKQDADGNDGDGNHRTTHHGKSSTHERQSNTYEREPNIDGGESDDHDQEPDADSFHQDHPPPGIKRGAQDALDGMRQRKQTKTYHIIRDKIIDNVIDNQKIKEDYHTMIIITLASLFMNLVLLFELFIHM
jgi:hypothetical protein